MKTVPGDDEVAVAIEDGRSYGGGVAREDLQQRTGTRVIQAHRLVVAAAAYVVLRIHEGGIARRSSRQRGDTYKREVKGERERERERERKRYLVWVELNRIHVARVTNQLRVHFATVHVP
jgi:hypothetical protein